MWVGAQYVDVWFCEVHTLWFPVIILPVWGCVCAIFTLFCFLVFQIIPGHWHTTRNGSKNKFIKGTYWLWSAPLSAKVSLYFVSFFIFLAEMQPAWAICFVKCIVPQQSPWLVLKPTVEGLANSATQVLIIIFICVSRHETFPFVLVDTNYFGLSSTTVRK